MSGQAAAAAAALDAARDAARRDAAQEARAAAEEAAAQRACLERELQSQAAAAAELQAGSLPTTKHWLVVLGFWPRTDLVLRKAVHAMLVMPASSLAASTRVWCALHTGALAALAGHAGYCRSRLLADPTSAPAPTPARQPPTNPTRSRAGRPRG